MKIPFYLLLCSVLALLCVSVNGDLGRLFGGIKDKVNQVRSDVRNALHIRNEDRIVFDPSEDEERNFNVRPIPETPVKSEKQTEASVKANTVKTDTTTEGLTTVSTTSVRPPTVSPNNVSPPTTSTVNLILKSNQTTEKDGRENFGASCSTGYQRTPDGRCMPTFK